MGNFVDAMTANYEAAGADYLGSFLKLSVSIPEDNPVLYTDFTNALLEAGCPVDWIPDPPDYLSVYLQTIAALSKAAISRFDIDPNINFDPNRHHSYKIVKRHASRDHEKIRALHKLFWYERAVTDFDGEQDGTVEHVNDVIPHEEIHVYLMADWSIRVKRLPNTEEYAHLDNAQVRVPEHFLPFLHTLKTQFQKKTKMLYTTPQIKQFLRGILFDRIEVDNMFRGLFFVHRNKMELVKSMSVVLKKLNPGIDIFTYPIVYFRDNPDANEDLGMIRSCMFDSISDELMDLLNDVDAKREKEAENSDGKYGVRDSTWADRYTKMDAIRRKMRDYENERLLEQDSLTFLLEELEDKILRSLNGDFS